MKVQVRTESKDTHTADVWRTVVTADGLPPDPPSAKEDDGTGQAPNVKHEGEVGETADAKQNEDDPPAAQVKQHILTDYEKDQLVRFDVVGDDDGLPAGRDLRDALGGQTKGIRFVDHPMVCALHAVLGRQPPELDNSVCVCVCVCVCV